MNDQSILPLLQKIPIFEHLDERVHKQIINNVTLQYYPADYELFKQGDAGVEMYIIKNGKVQIAKDGREVAVLSNNDFFGELALVSDAPRNASAKVLEDSEILILKRSDLGLLLANNPEAEEALKKAVIERN